MHTHAWVSSQPAVLLAVLKMYFSRREKYEHDHELEHLKQCGGSDGKEPEP